MATACVLLAAMVVAAGIVDVDAVPDKTNKTDARAGRGKFVFEVCFSFSMVFDVEVKLFRKNELVLQLIFWNYHLYP
jgi:hypothetical protein